MHVCTYLERIFRRHERNFTDSDDRSAGNRHRSKTALQEATDDFGWQYLGMHDLRRTWATSLRSADVDAMVVCDWGGWDDLDTFLDHYRGTHTPEAQLREREKVDWL
jgi:integrase